MKTIQLTQGQFTLIDDADYEELSKHKWNAHYSKDTKSFYATRSSFGVDGKRCLIRMHRQILGLEKGDKRQGDHIDHDTLNNHNSNLRVCSPSQNLQNQKTQRCLKSSRFKGVYWSKRAKKWVANIKVGGETKYLGLFYIEKNAACAYDIAALKYFGEFAHLNF